MNFDFLSMSSLLIISIILLGVGLAGILFMVVRKIPTLNKLSPSAPAVPTIGWGEKLKLRLREIKYSTYQPIILNRLEKSLRKLRLLILKIDNLFVNWIKSARHKSEIWTVRSQAWMEHRRLRKKEKAQVLEKLDKVEVSQELEKIKEEVAKEEDKALKEKIETVVNNGNGAIPAIKEMAPLPDSMAQPAAVIPENNAASEEEKKCIDLIAQNPKDVKAYRALGFVYLKQKNYSDARACFRQVLKIEPDDMGIKIKLNEIKGLRKKPE